MVLEKWSDAETQKLAELVEQYGTKRWCTVAEHMPMRNSKQCRRRWKNFLAFPERKDTQWTTVEDTVLTQAYDTLGPKWTDIATLLKGRTDNAVKNRWALLQKSTSRKSSQRAGLDDEEEAPLRPPTKRRRTGARRARPKRQSSTAATEAELAACFDDEGDAMLDPERQDTQQPTDIPPPSPTPCPQSPYQQPTAPQHTHQDMSDQTLFLQQLYGSLQTAALDTCTSGLSRCPSALPELLGAPSIGDPMLDPDFLISQPSGLTPIMHHFQSGLSGLD